jgi:hypothetical protein
LENRQLDSFREANVDHQAESYCRNLGLIVKLIRTNLQAIPDSIPKEGKVVAVLVASQAILADAYVFDCSTAAQNFRRAALGS